MHQDSRHIFLNILTESLHPFAYKSKIALLLDRDPYYIPAHLELLWFAEKSHDRKLFLQMLRYTRKIVDAIFSDKSVRDQLEVAWTDMEHSALRELIEMQLEHEPSFSYVKKYVYNSIQ